LSFAIPIDVANDVRTQLVSSGKVRRGRIGVGIQPMNAALAESFGLDRPRGALIGSVESGAPADKAGVKSGDIVLSVDGKSIDQDSELASIVSSVAPGKEVQLELWRDHATRKLNVRVAEMKEPGATVAATEKSEGSETDSMGLSVRPLQPDEQQAAKVEGGLLVEDVDGAAQKAGIQPGDVIMGVNGSRVRTVAEFKAAAKRSGKTVALLIQREGQQIFIPVRTE
jgi:serine protease Do